MVGITPLFPDFTDDQVAAATQKMGGWLRAASGQLWRVTTEVYNVLSSDYVDEPKPPFQINPLLQAGYDAGTLITRLVVCNPQDGLEEKREKLKNKLGTTHAAEAARVMAHLAAQKLQQPTFDTKPKTDEKQPSFKERAIDAMTGPLEDMVVWTDLSKDILESLLLERIDFLADKLTGLDKEKEREMLVKIINRILQAYFENEDPNKSGKKWEAITKELAKEIKAFILPKGIDDLHIRDKLKWGTKEYVGGKLEALVQKELTKIDEGEPSELSEMLDQLGKELLRPERVTVMLRSILQTFNAQQPADGNALSMNHFSKKRIEEFKEWRYQIQQGTKEKDAAYAARRQEYRLWRRCKKISVTLAQKFSTTGGWAVENIPGLKDQIGSVMANSILNYLDANTLKDLINQSIHAALPNLLEEGEGLWLEGEKEVKTFDRTKPDLKFKQKGRGVSSPLDFHLPRNEQEAKEILEKQKAEGKRAKEEIKKEVQILGERLADNVTHASLSEGIKDIWNETIYKPVDKCLKSLLGEDTGSTIKKVVEAVVKFIAEFTIAVAFFLILWPIWLLTRWILAQKLQHIGGVIGERGQDHKAPDNEDLLARAAQAILPLAKLKVGDVAKKNREAVSCCRAATAASRG